MSYESFMSSKGLVALRKPTLLAPEDLDGLTPKELAEIAIHRDMQLHDALEELQDQHRQMLAERHSHTHDPLTGLANKLLFAERLATEMAHARRGDTEVTLLVFDLDQFKQVNDQFGHLGGDLLLQKVAGRLPKHLTKRNLDLWSRWAGDEFALILIGTSVDYAEAVAFSVCAELARPFYLSREGVKKRVQIGASVGIATSLGRDDTAQALFERADQALYDAKAAGRGRYRFFSPAE